jgi:hypothetical protein
MSVTQFAVPTNDGGGKGNDGDGKGSASRVGDIFQTEIDAVNKLDEALEGVKALNAVVGLMENAAAKIEEATSRATAAIDEYVKKSAEPTIDKYAGTAMRQAIQDNMQWIVNSVLDSLRRQGL